MLASLKEDRESKKKLDRATKAARRNQLCALFSQFIQLAVRMFHTVHSVIFDYVVSSSNDSFLVTELPTGQMKSSSESSYCS